MQSEGKSENEMKTLVEPDEMTAMNYPNHKHAIEPTTAKYLLDFLYFTREEEQFRFYKKVSAREVNGSQTRIPRAALSKVKGHREHFSARTALIDGFAIEERGASKTSHDAGSNYRE